jgi:hypothetical protein
MFVYMIINAANGKYYIGKTISSDLRYYLSRQFWCAENPGKSRTSKPHLFSAIRKHGKDNFTIHCLRSDFESESDCLAWEQVVIKATRSQDPTVGYNVCDGGRGAIGYRHNPESLAKLTAAVRARGPEVYDRIAAAQRGIPKPEGFGETIRQALTGRTWTPEQREKIPQGIKNAIASGKMKVHQWTPEERQRQRAAVSVASKRRWENKFVRTVAWG